MADFHFIRPLWLTLIFAVPLLYLVQHRLKHGDAGWGRYISPALLKPLIRRRGRASDRATVSPFWPLCLAVIILATALAGPSWRQAPTPLKQPQDSLVIALDLSLSMLATDVNPDRLTLAKRKIRDILEQRQGGLTALLVYAGDAHVVTPLTEDHRTIEAMLSVLEPTIMPAQGNRTDLAVKEAINLLNNGAPGRGRILLIADDVSGRYRDGIHEQLSATSYTLSTLTVGTEEGGPIPLPRHGFIRDGNDIVITRANPDALADLARQSGGNSHGMTLDDTDIRALRVEPEATDDWQATEDGLTINRWQDDGYWLLWLTLPLLLLGWRRGAFAVLALAILPVTLAPRPAMALDWGGLWQREDQRGPELIEQNPEQAAERLERPGWRGSALYRAGKYEDAIDAFSHSDDTSSHYNRGNALARAGKLEEALEAYDRVLEKQPEHADARFNRDLVKKLLEQQQSQKQNGDEDQNQNQSSDQSDSDSQNSDSQHGDKQQSGDESQQQNGEQNKQQDSQSPDNQDQNGQQSRDQQQQEPEQAEAQQNANASPSEQNSEQESEAEAPAPVTEQPLSQGQEQMLRRIPDNPGGLLQRKFLQQYQQRQTQRDEGDTPW
ncbi:VWA domain-containing protein [Marinobacter litoralis]|uniref:VWA domain-containing protein n=1 Tax=Marinobacter litoralis TaxID=187981 RepID=UPI0018EA38C3|nr:VWA domain-containing protein [Marinobacter litoralis]MBJ6137451.1 VWA domain-containing protein [Marinobacter litoralis]